jgi:hypothetical protein
VLCHIISEKSLEVDKAKIEIIEKLPPLPVSKRSAVSWDMQGFTDVSLKIFPKLQNS